jgi:hypothetical protein
VARGRSIRPDGSAEIGVVTVHVFRGQVYRIRPTHIVYPSEALGNPDPAGSWIDLPGSRDDLA